MRKRRYIFGFMLAATLILPVAIRAEQEAAGESGSEGENACGYIDNYLHDGFFSNPHGHTGWDATGIDEDYWEWVGDGVRYNSGEVIMYSGWFYDYTPRHSACQLN